MKKGQAEMMGLAVIIVLISIAMVFVLKFGILDKPENTKQQFTQSQMASNFINTLIDTSTDCKGLQIKELFQDVTKNLGGTGHIMCDTSRNSKLYLNDTLDSIFSDTLEKWRVAYHFDATTNGGTKVYARGTACSGGRKSEQFPIPVDPGGGSVLYLTLNICS